MQLIFIYGPAAAGKLTIARGLAERTGLALFHNHLIVDAVSAVFPFGSEEFVRLRERFWLETIRTAAATGKSLIFTFAPEPTVAPKFAERVAEIVRAAGGRIVFIALTLAADIQEQRLIDPGRAAFGKLRSVLLLRELQADFSVCMDAMPEPAVRIDTGETSPADAVAQILKAMSA